MPYKDANERRAYKRKWYKKNSDKVKKEVRDRKKEIRDWLREYKQSLSCSQCPESHPACLDFHHSEGNKLIEISLCPSQGWSKERIKEEIAKCTVLCSNCHKKLHWKNQ